MHIVTYDLLGYTIYVRRGREMILVHLLHNLYPINFTINLDIAI